MCGIVGYAGRGCAAQELYSGLKKLEYRGYDSAGISTVCNGSLYTVKRSGRVEGLQPSLGGLAGSAGIGHTRWATHGEANDSNAHPHVCGRFALVHNGIIENYAELREELRAAGHTFLSQTDSEVIVRLIDSCYGGDILGAMRLACARLKGCWALAVLCAGFNGFAVARRGSPVIVGVGRDGCYAASDIYALAGRAHSYCVLGEGDMALVTAGGIQVFNGEGEEIFPPFERVTERFVEVGTDDCPHYMLKEIRENARTMRATCKKFLSSVDVCALSARLSSADKIVLVGCGTAYNAALAGARILGWACDCPVSACIAGEARYDPPSFTKNSVCIAVSQSGETADTLRAAEIARGAGACVIAVTNVGYSAVTRIAHTVLPVCAGAEVCVAATKSYIGQLVCLHLMAAGARLKERAECILKLADEVEKLASDGEYASTIAKLCARSRAVFFLGRGCDVEVAVEGSLKLKEVSYIFSDGYPAGELKHGTLALVDETVLSVVLVCDEGLADKCLNAVEQILSRRGRVAVITTLPRVAERLKGRVQAVWLLPPAPFHVACFLSATALQLIAYRTAVLLGRDPDKPRNLAKSVTVE